MLRSQLEFKFTSGQQYMIHRNTSKTATSNLRRVKKCQFFNLKARLKVLVVIIADDLVNHSESTYVVCRRPSDGRTQSALPLRDTYLV